MAKFEEGKIITPLHLEKAEVGKFYFYSDELLDLKDDVESDGHHEKLVEIDTDFYEPFVMELGTSFQFLYPYEEPPKQRMTNRQFVEWCSKGNGQWKWRDSSQCHTDYSYSETIDNKEVDEDIHIRLWNSEEWQEPLYSIYLRDCKHLSQDELEDVAYRDGC